MLRSAALSDPRVIELVNQKFVPVWINVRTTPLPALPSVRETLVNARTNEVGKVDDAFSRGFFVRTAMLSPDGQTLLNRQASTIAGSMAKIAFDGELGYAEVNPGQYLVMLRRALERQADARRIASRH
ncbi:MAG: hypothetical protein EXR72_06935 [Myxococcales bacterium]|nr:hypothetical protein [Myxococcales bacterium]